MENTIHPGRRGQDGLFGLEKSSGPQDVAMGPQHGLLFGFEDDMGPCAGKKGQ